MSTILLKVLEREKEQLLAKLTLIDKTIIASRHGNITLSAEAINRLEEIFDYNWLQEKISEMHQYQYYDINQPSRNKALLIIKTEKRFLHVREIARIMQQLEQGSELNQLIKKISPALCTLKKMEDTFLVSIQVGHSHFNTFWGCRDWLTTDGEIMSPYMYNEEEVSRSSRYNLLSLK